MRQDQFDRLVSLTEKLTDQVLLDIDTANWTASGTLPKDMTQGDRGDAYWCRKNAMASTALLLRLYSITGAIQRANTNPGDSGGAEVTPAEDETAGLLDKEIDAAEREARKLLDKALKRGQVGTT